MFVATWFEKHAAFTATNGFDASGRSSTDESNPRYILGRRHRSRCRRPDRHRLESPPRNRLIFLGVNAIDRTYIGTQHEDVLNITTSPRIATFMAWLCKNYIAEQVRRQVTHESTAFSDLAMVMLQGKQVRCTLLKSFSGNKISAKLRVDCVEAVNPSCGSALSRAAWGQ
jgi:hypothetical protein